ncbi:MAG TPA: hypothetical protein VME20_04215 [Acidimicrobiales bacterium]|nr:hypothetical protein [Acidimicrobiales bacterium]
MVPGELWALASTERAQKGGDPTWAQYCGTLRTSPSGSEGNVIPRIAVVTVVVDPAVVVVGSVVVV